MSAANNLETTANWRVPEWFPELGEETLNHLRFYMEELLKYNKVINLISAKTVLHADAIHFADSIMASRQISKKASKNNILYDLGSGNGFPGMIYGLLFKDQKVALVDSDERKCEFLKHVAHGMGLSNVTIQNKKIELMPPDSIQQAMCRGFAPLPRALLNLRKIVKSGGQIFHLKADEWSLEVSQIPSQLCSVWQPTLDSEYKLPIGDIKLYIVRTDRIGGI